MQNNFYPLQFDPIFKYKIWGGNNLQSILNKNTTEDKIGESWEISSVPNSASLVANGKWKGRTLNDLVAEFSDDILGANSVTKFGKVFPLLFKFLDAQDDLSIQVHPNDALATERHNSKGKTEMWYVVEAEPNSEIIVGFKPYQNKESYLKSLENNTILSILETFKVSKGDVFFLDAGTVHTIGKGLLIAEIQQMSDVTYRLYDYDRIDVTGTKRELHTEEATEAINFEIVSAKKEYVKQDNVSTLLADCPYFTTNVLQVTNYLDYPANANSFTVWMLVEGSVQVEVDLHIYTYKKGDSILFPASLNSFSVTGNATLLEIYIS
ncbi:MAG: mannose-6-phosphate isomerase [Flavobacterium sp.]|jgi:mannose-6-phosphate isomerase